LAAFLFFFISTLAAFEIRRARREVSHVDDEIVSPLEQPQPVKYRANETAARPRRDSRVRYLLGASFAQIVIVAALTLPFFFLIPRIGGGGVAAGMSGTDLITGFSDRVELGEVAKIKKSPRIVMRVRLDRRPTRSLRWRGVALNAYDDRVWRVNIPKDPSSSHQGRSTGDPEKDATFDRLHPVGMAPQNANAFVVEQRVVLEPLTTDTLFATRRAFKLRGPIADVSWNKETDAISAAGLKGRTTYTVSSDISVPSEQELRLDVPASSPEWIRRYYLNPPRLDPRISQLAHEITRNAPTPYDKARAIENYLKTSFHYTLDVTATGSDPLADFLFRTREGHCEYFATAMVIMLRTLEIPSRIVNGFQMGEYNELNDMYSVRDSDAHSWVEAYFPRNDCWIEFDPTPSAGINDYSQGGLLAQLRKYADAMEVFWLDYIVTLDSDEQASIMVELQQRLLGIKDRLLAYYTTAKLWTQAVLRKLIERKWSSGELATLLSSVTVLALSFVALYVFMAYRKRRGLPPTGYGPWWHRLFVLPTWRRRLAKRDYRQSAVLFYEQMLATARRAGLVKAPDQTPVEFALASGLSPIREITALYNQVRFGGAQLNEQETRRVTELLVELKKGIRNKRVH
jgi:transglutaminase-like putative cysteine protease